jgi:hypothetical protein
MAQGNMKAWEAANTFATVASAAIFNPLTDASELHAL